MTHRFIGQSPRSRNNSNTTRFMDVARHNSDFAFSRLDNTRAIGANQPGFGLPVKSSLHTYLKRFEIDLLKCKFDTRGWVICK